jgi:hypothetical protein
MKYLDDVISLFLLLEQLESLLLEDFLLLLLFLLQGSGFLMQFTIFTLVLVHKNFYDRVLCRTVTNLGLLLLVHLHLLQVLFLPLLGNLLVGSLLRLRHVLPFLPSDLANLQQKRKSSNIGSTDTHNLN